MAAPSLALSQEQQGCRRMNVKQSLVIALVGAGIVGSQPAAASLLWNWSADGNAVHASGTFTTDDGPDADGFYHITAISGTVNAATITALQPAGTAVPGNAGFPVDNLVSATGSQLTGHGFGFAASDGAYHNPFFFGGYRDYISVPPYVDGQGSEPTIDFKASFVSEPHALVPLVVGLGVLGCVVGRRRAKS